MIKIPTFVYTAKREIVVSGLLPLKTHQISVIAVYQDGIEMKEHTLFTHSGMYIMNFIWNQDIIILTHFIGRSSPDKIIVTPNFDGSPDALAEWTFEGVIQDLSHFCVLVEAEGRCVFEDTVTKDERRATLRGLCPLTEHKIVVEAAFIDQIQTFNSADFVHKGKSIVIICIFLCTSYDPH